jgi:hypothetical protein
MLLKLPPLGDRRTVPKSDWRCGDCKFLTSEPIVFELDMPFCTVITKATGKPKGFVDAEAAACESFEAHEAALLTTGLSRRTA